jgi:ribonuclease J
MDEAADFIEWAQRCGRRCVFEPDAAYLVYKFHGIKTNIYIPDSYRYKKENARGWFTELLANSMVVKSEEIRTNPSTYLLQNSYQHMLELLSLSTENGVYLHEGGEPLGEYDPRYANMRRILSKAGFEYTTSDDAYFGHAYPGQVKYFIDQVDPRVLIPCHTYNPERLLPNTGKQLLPELYQAYILKDHQLIREANSIQHE